MGRSRYTVVDAPPAVRRRWARKAAQTRCKNNTKKLRTLIQRGCDGPVLVPEIVKTRPFELARRDVKERGPLITPPPESIEKAAEKFGADPVSFEPLDVEEGDLMGRTRMANPELMVVHNPGTRLRRRRGLKFSLSVSRGRGIMRRKSRNHPMKVKIGGQRRGWRSYVKYMRKKGLSLKSIGAKWRKACRYHGPAKTKLCPRRKRRRSYARNSWKGNRRGHRKAALKGWRKRSRKGRKGSRRGGKRRKSKYCRTKVRKGSWKALVRKHGVKKASKMWRKRKSKCRVKRKK